MTASHRPTDHGERATCAAAVARVVADPNVPAPVAALAGDLAGVIVALDAARARNHRASCASAVATDRKNEAEVRFAAEVHRWLYTAFAAHGRGAVSRDVRRWMSDLSPSRWLELGARARLADLPGLLLFARDLAPIADLDQAGQALRVAVSAWEAARTAHSVASAAAEAAIRTFDRRYGVFVRVAITVDPDGVGARLSVFHRARRVRRADPPALAAASGTSVASVAGAAIATATATATATGAARPVAASAAEAATVAQGSVAEASVGSLVADAHGERARGASDGRRGASDGRRGAREGRRGASEGRRGASDREGRRGASDPEVVEPERDRVALEEGG